jgi:hypothetical protein
MSAAGGANTVLRISLPITADLASISDLGGAGVFYSADSRGTAIAVYADTTNNVAEFNWAAPTTNAGQSFSFTFMFRD